MIDLRRLKARIVEAIEVYNRYRSPEATAKLLSIDKESVKVRFTGSYCLTCGVYDYFEDLTFEFQDHLGLRLEIVEVREDENLGHTVTFKLRAEE